MVDNNLINPKIQSMKNLYSGQRCFIMGNGPSLKLMDLDFLKYEVVWGFNKCYLLFNQINWRPKFYITNDIRLTKDIKPDIDQLVEQLTETTFFFPSEFNKQKLLSPSSRINWYNETKFEEKDQSDWAFSIDPSSWVANSATVAIAGLQFAAYLGFNPIYLIGCDTSYSVPKSVEIEGAPENLVSTQSDDTNHFSSSYFGKGDKWLLPNVELMVQQYEKSKIILDNLGVNVYNGTYGGNLETFPRVNYESLFRSDFTN